MVKFGQRLGALTTGVVVALSVAVPAQAAIAPPGCNQSSKFDWTNNCWLGANPSRYDDRGEYVVTTQRAVRGAGYSPGPSNDGIFGSQTQSAVLAYQQSTSLVADTGVVTDSMWSHMYTYKLRAVGQPVNGATPYTVNPPPSTSVQLQLIDVVWQSRTATNSGWVGFSMEGPAA